MEFIFKLKYGDYLEIEDNIWFFNHSFNGLVCLGKHDGRIKHIYKDTEKPTRGKYLYSGITFYKRKIILTPLTSPTITLFDLDCKKFEYKELNREMFLPGTTRSVGCYQRDNIIYIFPANMSALIKFNAETLEVRYISGGIEKQIEKSSGFVFRNQYEVVEDKIYLPFVSCKGIAIYNLCTDQFEVKLEDKIENCSTISYKDGKFYIGSWKEKILYIWNQSEDFVKECKLEFTSGTDKIFNASWIQGNHLVLFPYCAEELIIYDIGSSSYVTRNIDVDMMDGMTNYLAKGENYTAYFSGSNEIKEINCLPEKVEICSLFKADDEFNKHFIAKYLIENGMYALENERKGSLEDLISVICNM